MPESALTPNVARQAQAESARPLLSVVVPVYNQHGIAENLRVIRERVEQGLGAPVELILVSDGSEETDSVLPEDPGLARVIQYDRNLGKGYAVKAGALAAQGEWISFVDADLDLDPAALPGYLDVARREGLDVVIGSKRHPDSRVDYPRTRRWGSWLFQKLVRVLFRLDVRDTQVGLKLFTRELSDEVIPLLLVKQYAFDLEFLAVARALGFDRIREMPVTLLYRSTGSGVRPVAVLLALLDTLAIFYRLRVLRYYQRKKELLTAYGRGGDHRPPLALVTPQPELVAQRFDYPGLELVRGDSGAVESRLRAGQDSSHDIVAFLVPGAVPAGNWLDSTIPFLANPEIAAVVTPTMTPGRGSVRERAAAALAESRLGGGSHYFRFTPGNLRFVRQFPAGNVVIRREDLLAVAPEDVHPDRLCAALNERGRKVLYTPETVVVSPRPPLFKPHLDRVRRAGHVRGQAIRREGLRGVTAASVPPVAFLAFLVGAWPLALLGGWPFFIWSALLLAYAAVTLVSAGLAALHFRSLQVGALTAIGSVAVHVTYAIGLLRGLLERRAS